MKKYTFLGFIILLLILITTSFAQTTRYVSSTGSNTAPYTSLATAATNIQDVITISIANDIILVDDGIYTLTSPIAVNKALSISSINGPTAVTIDGNGSGRCFTVSVASAVISGFTIINGDAGAQNGGGALITAASQIRNCIIHHNNATNGGGLSVTTGGSVYNCLIYSNTATAIGGGIYFNSTGEILNSTIVKNGSDAGGGGIFYSAGTNNITNTIVYGNFNISTSDPDEVSGPINKFNYSLSSIALSGSNNITGDPLFVNSGTDNYRLQSSSPAKNTGTNQVWMNTAKDLDGNNRIFDDASDIVDMGAYEYSSAPLTAPNLTLPINGQSESSISPIFKWDAVVGADSYTLELAENNGFTINLKTFTGITGTELNLGNTTTILVENKTYYWRLYAVKNSSNGPLSTTFSFTTISSLVIPSLLDPIPNHIYLGNEIINFHWYLDPTKYSQLIFNGTTFELQYSVNSDLSGATTIPVGKIYTAQGPPHTIPASNLLPGRNYWWRVRSIHYSGKIIGYSEVRQFRTYGDLLVPVPSWPKGGVQTYTNNTNLFWYVTSGGTLLKYQVQWTKLPDSNADGILDAGLTTEALTEGYSVNISGLTPATTYYWQVRSTNDGGTTFSDWSPIATFETAGKGVLYKPVITYPNNNIKVYNTAVYAAWYIVGSNIGLTWDVYYRKVGAGAWTGPFNTNQMFYLIQGLEPGASYELRVDANNGVGTNSSDNATFNVAGGLSGGTPVLLWPKDDISVYTNKPVLNWYYSGSPLGIQSYKVEYKEESSLWPAATVVNTTNTFYMIENPLKQGVYYNWRVSAFDGTNYTAAPPTARFLMASISSLLQPILVSPVGMAEITTTSTTLQWYINGLSHDVVHYQVLLSSHPDFIDDPLLMTTYTTTSTTQNVTGLTPGTLYYWKVRTFNGTEYSPWSGLGMFVTSAGAGPISPSTGSPMDGIKIDESTVTISWGLPIKPKAELTYKLELSENKNFTSPVVMNDLKNNFTTVSALKPGQKYYWRVKSQTSDQKESAYSKAESFEINSSTTDIDQGDQIPQEFSLEQNYPNPFNPSTVIKYSLPKAVSVKLKIYDVLGREIKILVNEFQQAGRYSLQFNIQNTLLSSGIYFYRIEAGDFSQSKKMIVLK